ncbi:MAG: Holliday junction branch migration DNA helicase RuvB [Candidatus Gastranaerophilales bacterium]|nr:Holliday junction branch migration DNA helicase RuvB [Candidatus Gastranaerophilales bacterium]
MIFDDSDKQKKKITGIKKPSELDAAEIEFDRTYDKNIRPKTFDEYIGQKTVKDTLKITISAAKKRNVQLDHILLYGPPGLGKTTLATIIAGECGVDIKITSAPALERPRDIIGILMSLKEGEILFIDEIHRLNKIAEEILYPAMEDFTIDLTTGKNQTVKTMRVPVQKFTLIGATTKAGALSGPLRDRFGIIHRLEFYSNEELSEVVKRSASILNISIDENGAIEIAKRSRSTPRIANRLVRRAADWALVKGNGTVDEKTAKEALNSLNIDEYGLDFTDRELLKIIIQNYNGGPVGIETLGVALGEDIRTIEDVIEPYLLQSGFLKRTQRGRMAAPLAYKHLGYKYVQNNGQMGLFE